FTVRSSLDLQAAEVGETDVKRVHDRGCEAAAGQGELLHALPLGYSIDGANSIRDPRGMCGRLLEAKLHMVAGASTAVRNLALAVERVDLDIRRVIAAPYAAGLGILVEDELDLGATVVDLGAGTTGIAAFLGGELIHVASLPVGGHHITNDIARGLTTTYAHAERMKTMFGSAVAGPADDRELIDVPLVGEAEQDGAHHVPRSALIGIIQPRLEEIFELVHDRMEAADLGRLVGRRVVLAGGGAELAGARDLAARVLDKQVRVGRPIRLRGLAEATGGSAFAAAAGALIYPARETREAFDIPTAEQPPRRGLGGIFRWLTQNF
ncbi:MAG: cell division protein FtsA, partial [Alphaproteobacteria bacterium]|nr:cell division protein FtsA [Alphaproteobacteria bacterium]